MPIQDIYGYTLIPYINSSLTIFTPSNVIVQGAISIAESISAGGVPVAVGFSAYVQRVNIPGYGEVELHDRLTTVRWVVSSITFVSSVTSTILIAVYSE